MRNKFAAPAAVLAVALAIPTVAFAGANCGSHAKTTATAASAHSGCTSEKSTTAWSGAWLERSANGAVTVAAVAEGSPAAKSGIRSGDVVLAVNGYKLSDSKDRALCASKADCNVGSKMTYTIQRGRTNKSIKLTLANMPADAAERFATREATFEPSLAAVVMPALN